MGEGPNREGLSRKAIMREVEESLGRLRTDYIDLYQLHQVDHATPIEETMRALDDLVRQGKVRYIGCSNFDAWQVCEAVWTARTAGLAPMVAVQPAYNMLDRAVEGELIPFCDRYGVGVLPYFPLQHGLLTGKYRRGEVAPEGSRLSVHGARHSNPQTSTCWRGWRRSPPGAATRFLNWRLRGCCLGRRSAR